jgi:hypothetical protein
VLHPEQVVEYPELALLPDALQQRLRRWARDAEQHYCGYDGVAIAPGWKVGGWTRGVDRWRWARPLVCACGELMELLLKVEGAEWGYDEDRGVYPWRPVEDADSDESSRCFRRRPSPPPAGGCWAGAPGTSTRPPAPR